MLSWPTIVAPLLNKKVPTALLVCQLALVLALMSNIAVISNDYLSRIMVHTGVDEDGLLVLMMRRKSSGDYSPSEIAEMMQLLRAVPGIAGAATVNQIPFGYSNWSATMRKEQNSPGVDAAIYFGTGELDSVLGVEIVAGRGFEAGDYATNASWTSDPQPTVVLISAALAAHLFGAENAVGATLYRGELGPFKVAGVYKLLLRPNLSDRQGGNFSAIFPMSPPGGNAVQTVLLRTRNHPQTVLAEVRETVGRDPERTIIFLGLFSSLRAGFLAASKFSLRMLVIISAAVLTVTLMGVYSTLSFWFKQRIPALTILRAIGVSHRQLRTQLQVESLIVSLLAIAFGLPLAYLLNDLVARYMQGTRIELLIVAYAALIPLIIGQAVASFVGRGLGRLRLSRLLLGR